jgi:tryptophan synthase beta subunit
MNSKFFLPALPGESPDGDGYFGAFGGKFIPEALVAAVDEVAIEYERAQAEPGFAAELEQLLAHYAGRPSVLTEVPRFARHAGGASVFLHDTGRGEYRPVTDAAAMRAFRLLASTEGIIPAIESAHALAGAIEVGTELGPDGLILVNLSGRGDKDMDTAARYFEQDADAARAGGTQK